MSYTITESEDFQRVKQVLKYINFDNVFGCKDRENDVQQHTVVGIPDIFPSLHTSMLKMHNLSQFPMAADERQTVFSTFLVFSKTKNRLNFLNVIFEASSPERSFRQNIRKSIK